MTPVKKAPATVEERMKQRAKEAGPRRFDGRDEPDPLDIETMAMPDAPPWPELHRDAYHGLAGEIVGAIEPETEADPVAILGQLLVAFGSAVGRRPYALVEGSRHYPNAFMTIVGKSAHGRKGTSWGRVGQVMRAVDEHWLDNCVGEGLSSGEGLITAVRDPVSKTGKGGEPELIDEGVQDKRLLIVEGEFAQCLRVLKREGNTLSPTLRKFWDSGRGWSMTKGGLKATDAHISIVGHITRDELRGYLGQTEMFNGFANRFLWVLAKRSKQLPGGGAALDLVPFQYPLRRALDHARTATVVRRTPSADRLWGGEYGRLTADRGGLFGAAVSRADAQTLRLSMLYALLDGSAAIDEEHLAAALALWDYAEQSAKIIFGEEPRDPLVVKILEKLKAAPDGLTRTALHDALNRNVEAGKIVVALAALRDHGQARADKVKTGRPGAPAERWFACGINSFVRNPSGATNGAKKATAPGDGGYGHAPDDCPF